MRFIGSGFRLELRGICYTPCFPGRRRHHSHLALAHAQMGHPALAATMSYGAGRISTLCIMPMSSCCSTWQCITKAPTVIGL